MIYFKLFRTIIIILIITDITIKISKNSSTGWQQWVQKVQSPQSRINKLSAIDPANENKIIGGDDAVIASSDSESASQPDSNSVNDEDVDVDTWLSELTSTLLAFSAEVADDEKHCYNRKTLISHWKFDDSQVCASVHWAGRSSSKLKVFLVHSVNCTIGSIQWKWDR